MDERYECCGLEVEGVEEEAPGVRVVRLGGERWRALQAFDRWVDAVSRGERFESWIELSNPPAFLASYASRLLENWVDPNFLGLGAYRVFADPEWRTRRRMLLAYGELEFMRGVAWARLGGESRKFEVLSTVLEALRSRIAEMLGAPETEE